MMNRQVRIVTELEMMSNIKEVKARKGTTIGVTKKKGQNYREIRRGHYYSRD